MMEAMCPSETSVLRRAAQHSIPEDGIPYVMDVPEKFKHTYKESL
jgi:hypothetical protein